MATLGKRFCMFRRDPTRSSKEGLVRYAMRDDRDSHVFYAISFVANPERPTRLPPAHIYASLRMTLGLRLMTGGTMSPDASSLESSTRAPSSIPCPEHTEHLTSFTTGSNYYWAPW